MDKKLSIGFVVTGILLIGLGSYLMIRRKKLGYGNRTPVPIPPIPTPQKVLKDAYDNLVFDVNKDTIKEISFPFLDEIVGVLKEAPDWKLKIEGHTDNVGTDSYNLDLSNRRANSVKNYLVSKGINENRITAEGFGESKPIADNSTKDGRDKNRRVEFKITKEGITITTTENKDGKIEIPSETNETKPV